MAEEIKKKVGQLDVALGVVRDWTNEKLANKVDKASNARLMTVDEGTKLASIASGAQVNVIEGIKVNNTQIEPANKIVDISVPVQASNIASGATGYATGEQVYNYVTSHSGDSAVKHIRLAGSTSDLSMDDENRVSLPVVTDSANGLMSSGAYSKLSSIASGAQVNVIESIKTKYGDTTSDVSISSKAATIDLSSFAKKADITTVMDLKGVKENKSQLPVSGNRKGDVWVVKYDDTSSPAKEINAEFVWVKDTATGVVGDWEQFGPVIDLSDYATTSALNSEASRAQASEASLANAKVDKVSGSRLMTNAEGEKLATVSSNADANVIDGINFIGSKQSASTPLTPVNKKVTIDVSSYALSADVSSDIQTAKDSLLKESSGVYSGSVHNYTQAEIKKLYDPTAASSSRGSIGNELDKINNGDYLESNIASNASSTKGAKTSAIVDYVTKQSSSTASNVKKWVTDQGYVTDPGVTSVGLVPDNTATGILTVSSSPVTSSGVIQIGFSDQTVHKVFAGPSTGANNEPSFRNLEASDLPSNITSNTSGNASTATKLIQGRTIAISGDLTGSETFDGSSDISIEATISDGAISNVNIANDAAIDVDKLEDNTVTLGSSVIKLGDTASQLTGLTNVTATTFTGNLTGNASTATSATYDSKSNKIDTTYATKEELQNIGSTFNVKGSVATIDDLPSTAENGDLYYVEDEGANYVYTTSGWVKFGSTIGYATSTKAGVVKVGDNISYSDGKISLQEINVITALGYSPIKTVSVNGEELPISNKGVNISVPTDYATQEDIDDSFTYANVKKALNNHDPLYGVKVNGVDLDVVDNRVNVSLTDYATKAWTTAEIESKVSSIYNFKGSLSTYGDLLRITSPATGDVYNITSSNLPTDPNYNPDWPQYAQGTNFAYDGHGEWDALGGTIDVSMLLSKAEAAASYVAKESGKGLSSNDFTDDYKASLVYVAEQIDNKVDKVSNKGLSTNDYTNAEKAAVATISSKVDRSEAESTYAKLASLTAHTSNQDIHLQLTDKQAWNKKYDKPTAGIPYTDLASGVQSSLDLASNTYTSKAANYVLAAPNEASGVPSFRALVSNDISDFEWLSSSEMRAILEDEE